MHVADVQAKTSRPATVAKFTVLRVLAGDTIFAAENFFGEFTPVNLEMFGRKHPVLNLVILRLVFRQPFQGQNQWFSRRVNWRGRVRAE